jgi:predicted HD superfamily hydrolase involved in NAD metabolism
MRNKIINWLKDNVSADRLQHILGVEKMSAELAIIHQVNPEKAAQAGLMHDLAKFFSPNKLLEIAKKEGLKIDSICENHPHLIHADVSAIVARDEFGVIDQEILDAISNHTLGQPNMSALSSIVFVADAIEHSRGNSQELETLRQISQENLIKSVFQVSDYSLQFLLKSKRVIHPRTILTRNWALSKTLQGANLAPLRSTINYLSSANYHVFNPDMRATNTDR